MEGQGPSVCKFPLLAPEQRSASSSTPVSCPRLAALPARGVSAREGPTNPRELRSWSREALPDAATQGGAQEPAGAREMEPVRSWGWAHGDEVPALGKLRARRGASGGKRGRVCSVRVSVFPATSARFLGGRAPPPPGGLEKDPKAGLDFEHRGGGKGQMD